MNLSNIQNNKQLQPYNSFQTKAYAKLFAEPNSVDELLSILQSYQTEKILIIGAGCNLFFTKYFDGLIIKLNLKGVEKLDENTEYIHLKVRAGEDWDEFVQLTVENGWSGLENLSLIPGTVGAAPVQNIGAYGTELKDVVTEVHTIDLESLEEMIFSNERCQFSYRNSIFKQTRKYIITSVSFRLKKQFLFQPKYSALENALKDYRSPSLKRVRSAIIDIRRYKLPDHKLLPNAGSYFKNPILGEDEMKTLLLKLPNAPIFQFGNQYKTSAAYLIDQAGLKGYRKGNVGTYENQPLIIVNYGTSDGNKIVEFHEEIQEKILKKFGILLQPEAWIF